MFLEKEDLMYSYNIVIFKILFATENYKEHKEQESMAHLQEKLNWEKSSLRKGQILDLLDFKSTALNMLEELKKILVKELNDIRNANNEKKETVNKEKEIMKRK